LLKGNCTTDQQKTRKLHQTLKKIETELQEIFQNSRLEIAREHKSLFRESFAE
jgi:hypothetical protein